MNPTQEPVVETVEPIVVEISDPVPSIATITQESEPFAKKGGSKRVKKLQFTRWGVILHEVSSHGSPTSKKHRALEFSQGLKKRKHDQVEVQFHKVTVETENDSDGSDIRFEDSFHISPRKDTPIESIFEGTSIPGVTMNVSDTSENIDSSEQQPINIPEKATIIPSGVSHTNSIMEEGETPYINVY